MCVCIDRKGDGLETKLKHCYRTWLKLQRFIFIVSIFITCLDCHTMCAVHKNGELITLMLIIKTI